MMHTDTTTTLRRRKRAGGDITRPVFVPFLLPVVAVPTPSGASQKRGGPCIFDCMYNKVVSALYVTSKLLQNYRKTQTFT